MYRIKNLYRMLCWLFSKRKRTELFLVKCLTADGRHIVKDKDTRVTMIYLVPNYQAMTMYANYKNKDKSVVTIERELEELVQEAIGKALKGYVVL